MPGAAVQLPLPFNRTEIRVIGIGGVGCHTLSRLGEILPGKVKLLGIDTGAGINSLPANAESIVLGDGFGSGGDQDLAIRLFQDVTGEVAQFVRGAAVVVVVAGLGRGTGTGISPLVAEMARNTGATSLAVVSMPFEFEGQARVGSAVLALQALHTSADSVFEVKNGGLRMSTKSDPSSSDMFMITDRAIMSLVETLVSTLETAEERFDEICRALSSGGCSTVGSGSSDGLHAGKNAVIAALSQLAADSDAQNLTRTDHVVIHIQGGIGMSHGQVAEVVTTVRSKVGNQAGMNVSSIRKIEFGGSVRVTLIISSGSQSSIGKRPTAPAPGLNFETVNSVRPVELAIFDTPKPVRTRGPMLLPAG